MTSNHFGFASAIQLQTTALTPSYVIHSFITLFLQDADLLLKANIDTLSQGIIRSLITKDPALIKELENALINLLNEYSVQEPSGSIVITLLPQAVPRLFIVFKDIINGHADAILPCNVTRMDVLTFVKNVILVLIEAGVIETPDNALLIEAIDVSIHLLVSSVDVSLPAIQNDMGCHCIVS